MYIFLSQFQSVAETIASTKMLIFEYIHKFFSISLMYKMVNGYRDDNIFKLVQSFQSSRSNNTDLVLPQFRKTLYKNNILCTGPNNNLPLQIKQLTVLKILYTSIRKVKPIYWIPLDISCNYC